MKKSDWELVLFCVVLVLGIGLVVAHNWVESDRQFEKWRLLQEQEVRP